MNFPLFSGLGSFSDLAIDLAQSIDEIQKNTSENSLRAAVENALPPAVEKTLLPEGESPPEPPPELNDPIVELLVEKSDAFHSGPEKDLIPNYNLLIFLASKSSKPFSFLPKICAQLNFNPNTFPNGTGITLLLLSTIYNNLPSNDIRRYHIFMEILKSVRTTASFDALKPQLDHLDAWTKEWGLETNQIRNVYRAIVHLADKAGETDIAYQHNVKLLSTYNEDDEEDESVKEEAINLAKIILKDALNDPNKFDFQDLASQWAVQLMSSDSSSPWIELLDIFISDNLEKFIEFQVNHAEWMEKRKLKLKVLERKIRLLTLVSIAASSPTRSLPYTEIASALQIDQSEVEMWVIDVIRAGLIEGKLSQLNSTFLIHRSTYRIFDHKQWLEISGRLLMWKTSLQSVLGTLQTERSNFGVMGKEQMIQ